MEVINANNVKIYNLSSGKSLPEWLSDRKRRLLQKKDVDVRRRIELIQDFEMPAFSNNVKVTKDGQYILATGVYKPRVRCYDVNNLSMKFERCFDSEVVKFEALSEDYSKLVFLHCDRYIEFHAAYGRYYRVRIPRFGRDLAFHYSSCDLYCVGASSEVYRLNLEQGRFLNSFQTNAFSINTCVMNPVHHLFVCGTDEGRVEAWDPRSRERIGILDCAFNSVTENTLVDGLPSVTALSFRDGLIMAVGTATGQILMYDIRANKPFLVKDHMYGLKIKSVQFHGLQDLVISMDSKIVKLWDRNMGKPYTSIQAPADLNDLCLVPNTGMMFLANEERKILTYYIPSLGPAPRWCSFLDNLTEELEESTQDTVYDDYKFVTRKDLEDLGLSHLIGSTLLRAYMHGFFVDIRLYHKAKAIADPFAYHEYRKKKIREKIEAERANRVKIKKLPKVNRDLAQKLMDKDESKSKQKKGSSLLEDSRFTALFENPEFQVDEATEEYRLLHPVVSKLEKEKKKTTKLSNLTSQFQQVEEEPEGKISSEEESEDSSDDERGWAEEIKKQHRLLRQEAKQQQREDDIKARLQPQFYELKPGEKFDNLQSKPRVRRNTRAPLGERIKEAESNYTYEKKQAFGNKTVTFSFKKTAGQHLREEENRKHLEERKQLRRSARTVESKPKFRFRRNVK